MSPGRIEAMLERVISGGQTGVDQAGWRAARILDIPTAGWMPRGFLTEEGPRPDFAVLYDALEMPTAEYPPRTVANVDAADGTLWLGSIASRGYRATHDAALARGFDYPFFIAYCDATRPSNVADWIAAKGIRTLNV